jgi:arylsulfatase A-like enzyme
MKGYDQLLFKGNEAHGSLFASILNDLGTQINQHLQSRSYTDVYPDGLPRLANTDVYYVLSEVLSGVTRMLAALPQPNFTYIHLLPPHAPYAPARAYQELFDDGWAPPPKKKHRLAAGVSEDRMNAQRRQYDQFVANIDAELGHLLDGLEAAGLMENSYIVFTSDHGEIFERGAVGHPNALIFEPNIRVPLLVHTPGQRQRADIHALTSNVDLLPTFLHLAGLPPAEWAVGQVLPGLGGANDPQRSIYVVEARNNPAQQPLKKASLGLIRWPYKLVHYLGYRSYSDEFEMYDLQNDPDELHNLYPDHPLAAEMKAELYEQATRADAPYVGKALAPNPAPHDGGGEPEG